MDEHSEEDIDVTHVAQQIVALVEPLVAKYGGFRAARRAIELAQAQAKAAAAPHHVG
jgi:F420-0:gamma-glutamyl ligase